MLGPTGNWLRLTQHTSASTNPQSAVAGASPVQIGFVWHAWPRRELGSFDRPCIGVGESATRNPQSATANPQSRPYRPPADAVGANGLRRQGGVAIPFQSNLHLADHVLLFLAGDPDVQIFVCKLSYTRIDRLSREIADSLGQWKNRRGMGGQGSAPPHDTNSDCFSRGMSYEL